MNYKEIVLPIMRESRGVLMSGWGNALVVGQKSSKAVDVVTEVDKQVEQLVSSRLKSAFPEIGFVGEEYGGDRSFAKFWLMDPIDGTAHFVRGLPFCTSMLALIDNGEVVFSAIYDFINDDMYWAEKGQGAFRNEERIYVSTRSFSESYLTWETHMDKQVNLDTYAKLFQKAMMVKTISAGWEYAMVATGKLEGRLTFDGYGYDYDYAPGALLVKEAGGVVTNVASKTYDYTNTSFIATNPIVYKELTEGQQAIFPIKQ